MPDGQGVTVEILRGVLAQIDSQWDRLQPPLLEHLDPGLSEDELNELQERFGIWIPPELRTWWGWHNGVSAVGMPWGHNVFGPGGYQFLSAEDALKTTIGQRELHPTVDEDFPGWSDSWLLFMNQGPQRLFVDCAARPFGSEQWLPVGLVTREWEYALTDVCPSLTQLAAYWAWLFENDYYAVQEDGSLGLRNSFGELPLWMRFSIV